MSFQAFQLKYSQLKCNFLEYFSVITAIKSSKGFLNSPLKNAISFILKREKICKSVYPYILKRSAEFPLKSTNKWENIFPSRTFQWSSIFTLASKVTLHTELQNFQFKFLHRSIYTNSKLLKMKLVNSPICSFCQMSEETLLHLFCECKVTREFWDNICNWLSRGKNSVIQLSSFDICFGYNITTPNLLLNQLILIGKVFTVQCKRAEYMPSINNYKILIKDTEKMKDT